MGVVTWVTCSFSGDHVGPYANKRHGHDWHVEAAYSSGRHKTISEDVLQRACAKLDHSFLDDMVPDPTNEGIAAWIGEATDARRVRVWRYDAGRKFGAEWTP